MAYKAIILDVDGTILPHGEPCVRPQVVAAIQAAQKKGIKVVIASGRTYFAIQPEILGGIQPDYFVCANGAQVVDRQGRMLSTKAMTPEEMYALVDYFEDFNYPLAFAFSDYYYAYVEYQTMSDFYHKATGHREYVADGEDQDRHLEDMPVGAFAILPPDAVQEFQQRYGHLKLHFVAYLPGYYDVIQNGMDKAVGVSLLMEHTGWKPQELVSMGDNDNDIGLMKLVGRSYCMENGSQNAKAAASHIAPSVLEDGVKAVVEQLFLQ